MKALVFEGPNIINVKDVNLPKLQDGELLLKVKASLICGTDIRIYRGRKTKGVRIPSILGHEFSGEIVEVGGKVDGFKVGDVVSVAPVIPCLTCNNCKHGYENLCINRTAFGYEYDGAFAEYVRIPKAAIEAGNVYHVFGEVPFEYIALAEPIACCINGQRNSPIKLGNVVVIIGAGPIGLIHMLLAKVSGARTVIVSEPNEIRRNLARELGADIVVDPRVEELNKVVIDHTKGIGADVVIMAIGIPSLVNQAIDLVRKRGTINLFAGFSVGDMPPVDVNKIHYNEIKIVGTSASTRKDHELALSLIQNKRIDVSKLISNRYSLDNSIEAFSKAESGECMKVAIIPNGSLL
ncbi:L-iditol 2-dehydrogenase [Thermohydrogenium kirishiense]|nr:L-iditol 2-dehydrogenase [Thermohydrogenium kirishiense]